MKTKIAFIVLLAGLLAASNALAAGSSYKAPSASKDIRYFNKGVDLMMDKKFAEAEKQFRKSLDRNDALAEAHNNLAYTLRKQGPEHYDEALKHYNRAIQLNPGLQEPYMYRGVLYVQMGNTEMALADHEKLVSMNSDLAKELEYVVVNGREKDPEQFFGVSKTIR